MEYVQVKKYGDLKPGDQIAVKGLLENLHSSLKALYRVVSNNPYYFHHGIYMGDYEVVHFHGETASAAKPCETDLKTFDDGIERLLFRVDYKEVKTFPPGVTIEMAKALISKTDESDDKSKWPAYNVIWNNCETMATYLKTGKKQSEQASNAIFRALKVLGGSAAAVSVGSLAARR